MTENTSNVENVVEEVGDVEKVDEPKTYTQAEVDNIVKGRLARERENSKAKYNELQAEYKAAQKELEGARLLSGVFAEGSGIKGSFAEQAKGLAESYSIDDNRFDAIKSDAAVDRSAQQKNMAYIEAERIVSDLDDEEMQEMYDTISEKPAPERTLTEKRILKKIESKVSKPKGNDAMNKLIEADQRWLNEQVEGVNLNDVVNDEKFNEYLKNYNLEVKTATDVSAAIKAFVVFNKQYIVDNLSSKRTSTPSTGSVKDSGVSKLKEHYTPEDVDNLSEKDLDDPEIMKRVRQSMTKWK
jgi:hypothetical protein